MNKTSSFITLLLLLFFTLSSLPSTANASPIMLKELSGMPMASVMQQTFQVPGTLLTLAKQSFVVVNPAICYGAEVAKICRVILGYQSDIKEETPLQPSQGFIPSLQKILTLTYKRPASNSKDLTIISAIQYF